MSTTPQFVYVTYIATTPEKLWEALTSPEFTRRYWFETDLESDWQVGSPIIFRYQGKVLHNDRILESDPPRRLSYSFHPLQFEELLGEPASKVVFELEPTGETVKLTVTHDGFPADSKIFPMINNGWPSILSNLKTLLESGQTLNLEKQCKS